MREKHYLKCRSAKHYCARRDCLFGDFCMFAFTPYSVFVIGQALFSWIFPEFYYTRS